jgi:hypothetical protein
VGDLDMKTKAKPKPKPKSKNRRHAVSKPPRKPYRPIEDKPPKQQPSQKEEENEEEEIEEEKEEEPIKEEPIEKAVEEAPVPRLIERVILRPPSNVDYPQITLGIARNMMAEVPEPRGMPEPSSQGGGNLNGSANIANLLGQSGTNASHLQMPRANIRSGGGNYCGTV